MTVSISIFLFLITLLFYCAADLSPKLKIDISEAKPEGSQGKMKKLRDNAMSILMFIAILTCALIVATIVLKTKTGVYGYKFLFFAYIAWAVYKTMTSVGSGNSISKRIAAIVCALAIGSGWIFYPHWATIDLAALAVAIWLLGVLGNLSFSRMGVISIAIVLYDAIHVFGTHLMQKAAGGIVQSGIPAMISIPPFQIGVGDIVLPGMVVVFGIRKAKELGVPILGAAGVLGYVIGFFTTLFALFRYNYPQPATIYLIPAVFIALLATARMKNVYSQFVNS